MGEGRDGHRPQWAPDAESERSPALWLSHGTTGLCHTPAPGRTITSSRSQWGRRSADSCTFEPPSVPAPASPSGPTCCAAPFGPRRAPFCLAAPSPLQLCVGLSDLREASREAPVSAVPPRFRGPVRSAAPLLPSGAPPPSRRRLPLAGRGLVVAFPAPGASACFRTAPQPALLPADSAPERSCHLRASSAPSLATLTLDVASCPSVRLLTSSILVVR